MKKNDRIAIITKTLCENPNEFFSLMYFCRLFDCAKSSISEDLAQISNSLKSFKIGKLETSIGVHGGVKYIPDISHDVALLYVNEVCKKLSENNRVLDTGFIYWSDVLCNPKIIKTMASIIANEYISKSIDYVLTMETKGIPLAYSCAETLGAQLVIARRNVNVFEGSSVTISYINQKGNIETMALPKRAIENGSQVLIVDDIIRAGLTTRGLINLMNEFNAKVVGNAFLLAEKNPYKRYVIPEKPLMIFSQNADHSFEIEPANWLKEKK